MKAPILSDAGTRERVKLEDRGSQPVVTDLAGCSVASRATASALLASGKAE